MTTAQIGNYREGLIKISERLAQIELFYRESQTAVNDFLQRIEDAVNVENFDEEALVNVQMTIITKLMVKFSNVIGEFCVGTPIYAREPSEIFEILRKVIGKLEQPLKQAI